MSIVKPRYCDTGAVSHSLACMDGIVKMSAKNLQVDIKQREDVATSMEVHTERVLCSTTHQAADI